MIQLLIDSDKRLWFVDDSGRMRKDTGGYLLYFGENEFEEIEISSVTNIHGNVIRLYDTSLVVTSDEEHRYPVSFTLTNEGTLRSDPIYVDAAMTSRAGEVAVYIRFDDQSGVVGRTNDVRFMIRSGGCDGSDVPRTLRITPKQKVQEFSSDTGFGRVEVAAVDAEDITVTPIDARQVFIPEGDSFFKKVTVDRPDLSLEDITVVPSDEAQYITADEDHYAIRSVRVEPIASALPLQIKRATPSASEQAVLPDSEYVALSEVRINPVTAAVDPNLRPENLRAGVSVLDITGTMENHTPSTAETGEPCLLRFYDYDGALLGAYTLDEAEELSALPTPPSHPNLTFLRYNRTLESALASMRQGKCADLSALYRTADGRTRVYIDFDRAVANTRTFTFKIYNESADAVLYWGDGDSVALTAGENTLTHTYGTGDRFVIEIARASGYFALGTGSRYFLDLDSSNYSFPVYAVEMGEGCTLNRQCFREMRGLQYVVLSDSLRSLPEYTFYSCCLLEFLSIPDGVISIGNEFALGCQMLRLCVLPDTLLSAGTGLFQNCGNLQRMILPEGITAVSQAMFKMCISLRSVTLSSALTSVGRSAFESCKSLRNIRLPSGVAVISTQAFKECYSLYEIELPDSLTTIQNEAFNHCDTLSRIEIPDSVTTLGTGAFQYCTSLLYAKLSSSITTLPDNLFSQCYTLKEVEIPDGVLSIGNNVFLNNEGVGKITIPSSVARIGNTLVSSGLGFTTLDMTAFDAPPAITSNTLTSIPYPWRCYVRSEAVKALFAAAPYWSNYASRLRVA